MGEGIVIFQDYGLYRQNIQVCDDLNLPQVLCIAVDTHTSDVPWKLEESLVMHTYKACKSKLFSE